MQSNESFRNLIEDKLKTFENNTLFKATYALFDALGIRFKTKTEQPLVGGLKAFYGKDIIPNNLPIYQHVQKVFFIGQITDASFGIFLPEADYDEALKQVGASYKGILVFAIELRVAPTRTEMAALTRSINQLSKHVPVIVVYCYKRNENLLITLAATERLKYVQNWREGEKIGKISILKDINIKQPHAGHIRILADLKLSEAVFTFDKLLEQWRKVFDTQTLNNNFYKDLLHWYLATVKQIRFIGNNDDKTRAILTIKIVSRLIFLWFLKEKGLIAQQLFNKDWLKKHLTTFEDNDNSFYIGILANLFFNTVNEKIENRFKKYNILYEYLFLNPDSVKQAFNCSPFVNGGLFDPSEQEAATHLHQWQQMFIPNKFFFGTQKADLHEDLNDKKSTNVEIKGLIDILSSYKFTIEENTPLESEVALDPELLGKIFENLLASYNEETKTTARKATGSYYTPREIVEYMVDQSLIAYLEGKLFPDENSLEQQTPITSHSLGDAPDLFANANNPEIHITKPKQRTLEDLFQEQAFDNTQNTEKEQFRKDLTAILRYDTEGGVTPSFATQYTHRILDAIDTLKILDPAVGSGAFPMGILQKITLLLKRIDPNNQQWLKRMLDRIKDKQLRKATAEKWKNENIEYIRKLGIIESAIYGIDIQPIAVQIAKLRFFISLVIEQATNNEPQENYGIQPLPNLDFKFVCANTLIDAPTPLAVPPRLTIVMSQFEKNVSDYFSAITTDKKIIKEKILQNIDVFIEVNETYIQQIIKQIRAAQATASEAKMKKLREQIEELSNASRLWLSYKNIFEDKPILFFKTQYIYPSVATQGGFDIVIGNPPYIKEYTHKNAFDGLRHSPYYEGKMDLWYFFACHSLDLLKKNTGILTFIATNNWVTNAGASKMREKVVQEAKIEKLIDFGAYMIFDSADIQTMIMIFKNQGSINNYYFDLKRIIGNKPTFDDTLDLIHGIKSINNEMLIPTIDKHLLKNKMLTFSSDEKDYILKKISLLKNFQLDKIAEIAQGIVAPQDFLNNKNYQELRKQGYNCEVGDGIFILSNIEKKQIPFTQKEMSIIKPYYDTTTLNKYYGNPHNQFWILYTDSSFKNRIKASKYPNVMQHLDRFASIITSDNRPYGLHRSRDEYFFKGEKIISLRKCIEPTFTYTNFDCYVSQTFFVIKTNRVNQKYLTALLNSRIIAFWLRNKGKMQGNIYQIDKEPLLQIPIYVTSEDKQNIIIQIVDYILYLKSHPLSSIEEQLMPVYFEQVIDGIIYELYFETELKAAKVDVLAHLGNLPPLSNVDTDDAKMAMLKTVFNRLYDPRSEVRNRLTFMQNVKEIAIIEGKK